MSDYALNFNATQAGMITNSIDSGFILLILVSGAFTLFLTIILSNQKRFDDMIDAIMVVVNSFKYAIVGVLALLVGYMLYLICCKAIADSAKGIDPIWYVYVIGGYIALTAIGAIVIRVVELLTQMYARYVESKKQKEIVA